MPALNTLAGKALDPETLFSDRVHFIHVYAMEPHPMAPDVAPQSGIVLEDPALSTVRQPRTYAARLANAALLINSDKNWPLIQGNQIQLVDDLDHDGLVNPVWCTYGTSPNATYLIGQDGIIRYASAWTYANKVETAIRDLLAE